MYQTIKINHTNNKISIFDNGSEVREAHLMIAIDTPTLPFEQQLEELLDAYTTLRKQLGMQPVFKRYFLSDAGNQYNQLMNYELEGAECALSVIQQPPLNGTKIALWAYMMSNVQTKALPCGLYEARQGRYRHLWLGSASNKAKDSEHQTRILLNDYIMQLLKEGCTLADNCLRTWLFVHDVDNNYAGVVKARNEVFITQNLTDRTHFIASTGIGGRQQDARILTQLDAYAVDGLLPGQVHYLYAPDHLNRTSDYGVSFERGTYVDYEDRRHVFISGTASINNKGEIMYHGNVCKQCERMWENVEALLKEASCTFDNVCEMVVYLRDIADYQTVASLFEQRFPRHPYLIVNASVCRPGWLIEMECMAIQTLS